MAKRYCDYDALTEGAYKPASTLGTHCADVEVLHDRKIVRSCLGDVVSLDEVATYLGINKSTVARMCRRGDIKSWSIGSRVMTRWSAVDEFLSEAANDGGRWLSKEECEGK